MNLLNDDHQPNETEWKWRYSIWLGIMYGPIPVGAIIGGVILLILLATGAFAP